MAENDYQSSTEDASQKETVDTCDPGKDKLSDKLDSSLDPQLYQKMLKEREARQKSQNEYFKRKYHNDSEYRQRNQQSKLEWARRKYREDPEFAEKQKAYQRQRYALRKQRDECV